VTDELSKYAIKVLYARFEVFTVMEIKVVVFWVVTPCSDVKDHVASIFIVILPRHYTSPRPTTQWLQIVWNRQETGRNSSYALTEHHAMKAYWGSGGIAPRTLTSALDGGEWSASRPGSFTPRALLDCLFEIFAATLHIGMPFPPS
jgi:hypothetical protein